MLEKRQKDSYERGSDEGYARGHSDGVQKARDDAMASVEERVRLLDGLLRELETIKRKILTNSQEDIVELATVIASKIIHREVKGSEAVVDTVREAIDMASDKHSIRIKLNPADIPVVDSHKGRFLETVKSLERIELVEDNEIIPGGCIVETTEGSVDARLDRQMEEIRKMLLGG
jgi:flagellar assembly protein FliH